MHIAVDFDGTIVEHKFPGIGRPVVGALSYLRTFKELGATLILWTMRSDMNGECGDEAYLQEAIAYCRENGVEFDHHNEHPGQERWTLSPKAYAHIYIDDAAFGCPLVIPEDGTRPYVDWSVVGPAVVALLEEEAVCDTD